MKTTQIIATAAFALLAAAGAHADVYDYVPNVPTTSVVSRSETSAQAVAAAHGADIYRQSAMSGVVPTRTSAQDRAAVRVGAVAAAHAPYQNMQPSSFVNSRMPADRGNGFSTF
ncbi:alpha/beta hydrolase [Variovorax sp. PvP013]|jgi:hypothetical protein|uniref:alpha/beta hydrolase n=1 Tax=Variovorax sp. PvP013 TaxID=3156435 RepID=UPI003D1989F3